MKKITACFLSFAVVIMSSTGLFYAESQNGSVQSVVTSTTQASETNLPSSTPSDPSTTVANVTATPTPSLELQTPSISIQIPGLTDDAMFNELLLKKQTLDDLVTEENRICEMISEQETYNINSTLAVSVISKTYSSPYLKIIDDIKILLSPVKEKMVLNSIELGKNKIKATVQPTAVVTPTLAVTTSQMATPTVNKKDSAKDITNILATKLPGNKQKNSDTVTPIATPKVTVTVTPVATPKPTVTVTPDQLKNNYGSSLLEKEVGLSYNQVLSLNLAIKGMRESLKYISVENNEIIKMINEGQTKINKINNSIAVTNKKIVEDKLLRDKEWESFCDAMYKKDLKAACASYDNMIVIKERMVKNYQSVLLLKKKIEQILLPLETLQNYYTGGQSNEQK